MSEEQRAAGLITSVTIQNFKSIRDLTVPLEPLTAFIGYQDAGKSAILQAIALALSAASLLRERPEATCGRLLETLVRDVLHAPLADVHAWRTALSKFQVTLCLQEGRSAVLAPFGEGSELFGMLPEQVPCGAYIHFSSAALKRPVYVESYPPRLASDGENLPAVLAYLKGERVERFLELQKRFNALVPTVAEILTRRCPVVRTERRAVKVDDVETSHFVKRAYMGDCLAFRLKTGEEVPAEAMSDGAMRILGYLTALMAPPVPDVLLIEGPEEGLHPKTVEELVASFRQVQNDQSVQILLTTHSPDFVSWLKPEEIIVVRRGTDGYTEARRMADVPNVEKWMEVLNPGDLWLLKGEEGLLQMAEAKNVEETAKT